MKEVTLEFIKENPQDFIVSDPPRCAPCRRLEQQFEDLDFPTCNPYFKGDIYSEFDVFCEKNKLHIGGIPRLIKYRDQKFMVSDESPFDYLKEMTVSKSIQNINCDAHGINSIVRMIESLNKRVATLEKRDIIVL